MTNPKTPWILSARFDLCFILAPAIVVSFLVLLFADAIQNISDVPPWLWLFLIVGIDAGHVYASLFRTYFDNAALKQQGKLLVLAPLVVWLLGCLIYHSYSLWFWRCLAYLAVFHFVRQQYGFMMIYARTERHLPSLYRRLDKAVLYAATLCPLIIWHTSGRQFNWFVEDDFFIYTLPQLSKLIQIIFWVLLLVFALKESFIWQQSRQLNLPKNLLILGTALSWHVGIVAFDNDLIFTATNVIAHGIPYYALTWIYGYKRNQQQKNNYIMAWVKSVFTWHTWPFYLSFLIGLAYLEEGFWDGLIWREHSNLFTLFTDLPVAQSNEMLSWLVPLLTVPQATHYVLDAFIWRLHSKNTEWKAILFAGDN